MSEQARPEVAAKTSSLPSDEPREQVELFHDVLEALEKEPVPYAVSGAFASGSIPAYAVPPRI